MSALECHLALAEALAASGFHGQAEVVQITQCLTRFEDRMQRERRNPRVVFAYIDFVKLKEKFYRRMSGNIVVHARHDKTLKAFHRLTMSIFRRGLSRCPDDLSLWAAFLKHASSSGSRKVVSRALAQALRLIPQNPGLWAHAISWESLTESNPHSSRILVQRALRVCPCEKELWWLYFDLELRYTATIRDRQKSLELKPACLLEAKVDANCHSKRALPTSEGALAMNVFTVARSRYPRDFDFLMHFLVQTLNFQWAQHLESEIRGELIMAFPLNRLQISLACRKSSVNLRQVVRGFIETGNIMLNGEGGLRLLNAMVNVPTLNPASSAAGFKRERPRTGLLSCFHENICRRLSSCAQLRPLIETTHFDGISELFAIKSRALCSPKVWKTAKRTVYSHLLERSVESETFWLLQSHTFLPGNML